MTEYLLGYLRQQNSLTLTKRAIAIAWTCLGNTQADVSDVAKHDSRLLLFRGFLADLCVPRVEELELKVG